METLADLIAYKERKQESVSQKKEQLKTLNTYFSEHKYSIIWAQVNPFVKGEKNSLTPYIDGLLSVVPPQLLGLKPAEISLLTANTSPTALGLLLGKIALRGIVKRFKNKSTKRKKKKAPEVAE
jgi:hypothetical protein